MANTSECDMTMSIGFFCQFANLAEHRWNVSPLELLVLDMLQRKGKGHNSNIVMLRGEFAASARKLGCSDSNLTRMLDRFEDAGLARRLHFTLKERRQLFEDSPGNDRMGISLTTKGIKLLEEVRRAIADPSWFVQT